MQSIENRLTALCKYVSKEMRSTIGQGCAESDKPIVPELDIPETDIEPVSDYDTVHDMGYGYNLVIGSVLTTAGYHKAYDGGGAKYKITGIETPYTIPLPNGMYAQLDDGFDVRKFGLISDETLDQSDVLERIMRYVDHFKIYVVDFLDYKIMAPTSNPKLGSVLSIVRGMWHSEAHLFRNLLIANDKTKRLEYGQCCIIFIPDRNPDTPEVVRYENVQLDPWVDNFAPWNEGINGKYVNSYDGLRLGIFAIPRLMSDGSNPIFQPEDPDISSNWLFEYENIEFLSPAHSYNISQAAVRSRKVSAKNIKGDAFLQLNLDAVETYTENIDTIVCFDKQEVGRPMVMCSVLFEPEHGHLHKKHLTFNYDKIHTKNNRTRIRNKDGTITESGQGLWTVAIGNSVYKHILVENCSGNVECASPTAVYEHIEIKDCPDHTWLGVNKTRIKRVTIDNSVIESRVRGRAGFIPPVAPDAFAESWVVTDCTYKTRFYYGSENIPKALIGDLVFDNIKIDYPVSTASTFTTNLIVDSFTLKNSDLSSVASGLIRYSSTIKNIDIDNVQFGVLDNEPLIDVRYLTEQDSTNLTLNNVSAITPTNRIRFLLSGTISAVDTDSKYGLHAAIPRGVGSQTRGIGSLIDVTPQ